MWELGGSERRGGEGKVGMEFSFLTARWMKLSFSVLVLPWRLRSRVGGITCNAEGFAGETDAVDVLERGERDTNDLLSCSHYSLK